MSDHDFDDGLIHSHNWAMLEPTPTADANHPGWPTRPRSARRAARCMTT